MNRAAVIVYWLVCLYTLGKLVLSAHWAMFIDFPSMLGVIAPALACWFTPLAATKHAKLWGAIKVCWLAAGLMFIYGLLRILMQSLGGVETIMAGLGVALLPLFYSLIINLFAAPYLFFGAVRQVGSNQPLSTKRHIGEASQAE
ncbi:hypothetical protein [Shewanella algae]|uniref:hypothetical protein n=1 Tax=Shewanella algae TaxID=38313 RepID=UPI0031F4D05E